MRHGETDGNAAGLVQGQSAGTGLSPRGREQVQDAAAGVRAARPAAVVSSDLVRCRQTAAALAAACRLPVHHDPGVRERSSGRLEGLLWDASRERLAGVQGGRVVDPARRPLDGESLLELQDRVRAALARAADGTASPVVVVTHGGPVRVTLGRPLPGSAWGAVPHVGRWPSACGRRSTRRWAGRSSGTLALRRPRPGPPLPVTPRGSTVSDGTPSTPLQNTTFPSGSGEAHGYLALPPGGSGPGVIVIQEWWGLTDHIAGVADRLAAEGFVALAPDLFGGRTAHDADEAGQLMSELPVDRSAQELAGAVDFLLAHEAVTSSTVGAVGFCMGGGFVLLLAAQQGDKIGAAVPFYGVGPGVPETFTGLTAAVQGHYGERDDFYPAEAARAQEEQIRRESGAPVEFFFYEAGHAFHNDTNALGTYSEGDAATAWNRTVAFLRAQLS